MLVGGPWGTPDNLDIMARGAAGRGGAALQGQAGGSAAWAHHFHPHTLRLPRPTTPCIDSCRVPAAAPYRR